MKILITESQLRVISESNKLDVLINKIGLDPENAEIIYDICGPFSIILGKKLIEYVGESHMEYMLAAIPHEEEIKLKERWKKDEKYRLDFGINILKKKSLSSFTPSLTSIMDWIRVGLNGNLGQHKNEDFRELYNRSHLWHKSLSSGESKVNYKENNEIIRDYRDKNGVGYYWVNLNTNNSKEECDRMGHCGRTSPYNTLYSLRQYYKQENYLLNKSVLTAAVGKDDGIIYQLKGVSNSKPKSEYHPYILDLLLNNKTIKGFGSEYSGKDDFSVNDLGDDDIIKLYKNRPELFNRRKEKIVLSKLGLIDKINNKFLLRILPNEVSDFVNGDFVYSQSRDKNGNVKRKYFFEQLLSGDIFDIYDLYDREIGKDEWQDTIHLLNKENTELIWSLVRDYSKNNNIDIEGLNLVDAINETDYDELKSCFDATIRDLENSKYYDYVYDQLRKALSEYGKIVEMDDRGVTIECDLDNFIDDVDDIDNYFDNCNDDLPCVLGEILYNNVIDKPRYETNDYWYPSYNDEEFNEILRDRLGEI